MSHARVPLGGSLGRLGESRKVALPALVAVVLALVAALSFAPSANAATINVDPGGGGNYTTIQAAVNNASPGDVIRIKTGTYNENVDLSQMGSAINGATGNVSLVAADGPGTAVLGGTGVKLTNSGAFNGGLTVDGLRFSTTNDDGVRLANINNVVVVNSTFDPIGSDVAQHNGFELSLSSGAANVVLYQNTFRNIANDAIQILAQGTAQPSLTIVGNTISDDGTNANTTDQAIALTTQGSAVARATIADNTLNTLQSRAVALGVGNTAQLRASVVRNTISAITTVDQAISAETLNSATTASLDATIADNTISNISSGDGVFVSLGGLETTPSQPAITARVLRNTLTNIGNNDFDRGIEIIPGLTGNTNLDGTVNALVENNQLTNIAASGLYLFADSSVNVDGTVRNNTFQNTVTFPSANEAGFLFRTNNAAAQLRLALTGNTATTATPATNSEIRLLQQIGTLQLEGNPALTTEQNVAADNPSATGSILVGGTIGNIARGTVVAPGENGPPAANDDSATAVSGAATPVAVLANDTDPNADARQLAFFTPSSFRGGTVTRNDNGTPGNLTDDRLVYTAPAGFSGTDTFYYTVTDNAGASDVAKVTVTVISDETPPDTTIDSNPANPSTSASASFSFSGTDNPGGSGLAGFECKLDAGSFAACTSPKSYSGLADGTHTFQVRAIDKAGNVDATPASFTWTIDATPPETTIDDNPEDPSDSDSASFAFSGTENPGGTGVASFECKLDGGSFAACTSPQSYSALSDGSHTFEVRAIDGVGHVDPTPASFAWIIDTVAPTVAMSSATSNPTSTSPIPVTVQFSENVGGFSASDIVAGHGTVGNFVAVDGDTYTFDLTPSGQGTATADIAAGAAQDAAGNGNTAATQFSRTFDSTGPEVTIDEAEGQNDPTGSSPIDFTAVFNEPVTGFATGDVTLVDTAGATTVSVAEVAPNDGTTYNVAVSGMTSNGTVSVSIPANVATDAAGNGNAASTSTDNTVTFTLNGPPTANPDSYSVDEDSTLAEEAPGVLGDDTDPNAGDTLTAVLVSGPSNASSFALKSDGSFTYTPDTNFNGGDSFTYKARDASSAESGTATVTITVNPVNDDPDAVNDTTTTNEDTEKVIDVLANDSFAPDTGETLSVQSVTDASDGTVSKITGGPDAGKVLYKPDTDFFGTDSFTYTVSDGNGGTDTATVNVTVSAVNDAPEISVIAGNASQSACLSDTRGRITLKLIDVDNDVSTFAPTANFPSTPRLVSNVNFAANGESRTATISTFSGRTGDSTVTFSVSDGQASSSVTVTVKVRGNGSDTLDGTGGADLLLGQNGNDALSGLGASDLLCAGRGNDRMSGGSEADSFDGGSGTDIALDFSTTEGDSRTNIP